MALGKMPSEREPIGTTCECIRVGHRLGKFSGAARIVAMRVENTRGKAETPKCLHPPNGHVNERMKYF